MHINFLKKRNILLAAFTLLLVACSNQAIAANIDQYKQYMEAAEKIQKFTGSVLVAQDGNIIFTQGYGRADFESDRPNLPETRFAIGSVTKQFTAAAIMQLVEQGKLSLADPISKFFPDYPEDVANKVNIRHLLTHTSGIVSFTSIPSYNAWKTQDTPLEVQINTIASLPLEFEPGTKFSYSNSGYKLLEAIILNVTGIPWSQYVIENVLKPAGMTQSGSDLHIVDEQLRALGYEFDDNNTPKRANLPISTVPGGAGALYSSVIDLLKWDQALYTEKILSKPSLDSIFTPFLGNYGFGWMIDSLGGQQRYWHDGLIDGFTSAFERMPQSKLCIAVLANNHELDARRIANGLTAIALDLPYDVPVVKTPIAADPSKYLDYAGAYQLGGGHYRLITTDKGKLYSQRTGGAQIEIFPEAPDKFFYDSNNATYVTFIRDESGKVIAHMMHQDGVDSRHDKASADESKMLMTKYAIAKVDPAVYDRYTGEYRFSPLFAITVERKGDQIFGQATGQPQFEMYPSSDTKFFLKVVDAQIEFTLGTDGKAESLTLFQNGLEQKAPRVK